VCKTISFGKSDSGSSRVVCMVFDFAAGTAAATEE
jgi:hypothetical protein